MFISKEDYKKMSKPKKISGLMAGIWGAGATGLSYLYQVNREIFFKRFLLTPFSVIFGITPIAIGIYFVKTQRKVY